MDPDSDPLTLAPSDNLSLFGDHVDNIELVIEDDNIYGSKSNRVIQVTSLNEGEIEHSNQQEVLASDLSTEKEDIPIIDLDSLSPGVEEIKDEEILELEEIRIQSPGESNSEQIFRTSIALEKTVDLYQDGKPENMECYVPECTSNVKEKVYWFGVPLNENLKKIWDISIDRKNKRLSKKDVVCSKHFSERDLYFEAIASDEENEATISHNVPKLRREAVPCIKFHEECCVPTCRRKSERMYCFPVIRSSDFQLWMYMIKSPVLKKLKLKDVLRHRICEQHFELDCFDSELLLNNLAAPTLKLPGSHSMDYTSMKPILNTEMHTSVQTSAALVCAHRNCTNRNNTNKNIFPFPLNPERCVVWLKACGRNDLITTPTESMQRTRSQKLGVCEDHFDYHHFGSTVYKLEFSAVPKACTFSSVIVREPKALSLQENKKSANLPNTPDISKEPVKEIVDAKAEPVTSTPAFSGICFYKGCHSTPSKDNWFFSFPAEPERYNVWLNACGRRNLSAAAKEKIRKSQQICHKHFVQEMFKGGNKLRVNAVPMIYNKQSNTSNEDKIANDTLLSTENINNGNQDEQQNIQAGDKKIYCAVEHCFNYSIVPNGNEIFHKFPNPISDSERFNIWLQLIANKKLSECSSSEIYTKYMVCIKHFDSRFYENGIKSTPLSQDAVPTLNLSEDIKWFFDTDFYKNRVHSYIDSTAVEDTPEGIEWRKEDTVDIDLSDDRTRCILGEDRIRFPGMGCYLYLGKTKNNKRKFPYGVYKHFKTGYGLTSNIDFGENIRIHTAIIIDDDDDSERAVLQQLLDKRRRV